MERLRTEEQKLHRLEGMIAETGRLQTKAQEDAEGLRKKQEGLLAEPEGVTVQDLHKVQTALEAKEKEGRDRAATIEALKTQANFSRNLLAEIRRELFREGMAARTAVIVEAAGDVAHRVLVHLDELAREARETVLEPNTVFQSEVSEVLNTKEGKAQRVAERLRAALDYMAQARGGLEAVMQEAKR